MVERFSSGAPRILGPLIVLVPYVLVALGFHDDQVPPTNEKPSPLELKVKDVVGESIPDTFYERDGHRLYVTIDGKPAVEYFQRTRE